MSTRTVLTLMQRLNIKHFQKVPVVIRTCFKDFYIHSPYQFHRNFASNGKFENVNFTGINQTKAKLILQMNFKSPEDAVPFYKLPIKTLIHIQRVTEWDKQQGYCENRLYYISERIQCPASVLSVKLSKRTFLYGLSFDWLKKSLDVLTEMGVNGERILRDLWVLKYHHETIRERLQTVKDNEMNNLYPWMVRCSGDILKRSIQIFSDTRNVLGEVKSTHNYLANRLNISIEAVEEMCIKVPALKSIRATKVKHFMDFLTSEGYQTKDIANKPRILCASLKTIKQRFYKLRSLGVQEINLNVLARSRKDFKKYCESIQSVYESEGVKKEDQPCQKK